MFSSRHRAYSKTRKSRKSRNSQVYQNFFKLCNKLIEIRFGGQGRAGSGVYIQKIIGGGGRCIWDRILNSSTLQSLKIAFKAICSSAFEGARVPLQAAPIRVCGLHPSNTTCQSSGRCSCISEQSTLSSLD